MDDTGTTIVSALARLPRGEARGYRFLRRDRTEAYYPYERLEAEAHRRAAHLHALGLSKGDTVALVIAEPEDFVLALLGAVVAGVVPVPIFPRASFKHVDTYLDTLTHIADVAGARVVLCMEGNLEVVKQLEARSSVPRRVLTVESAFAGETPAFVAPTITPEDVCFLQFTSGSTNKPKGVVVTHANLVANAGAFLGPHGLDRRDDELAVSWLPLFHDMGLIGFVFGTILRDIPAVLMPTETFARSPGLWIETLSKLRATITFAPNFAYGLVTKRIKDKDVPALDLSRLRVAGCGAEPIRAQTLEEFAAKFAPAGLRREALLPCYGMAESTLAITFHPVGTPMRVDEVDADALSQGRAEPATAASKTVLRVVGCGKPFPGHTLRIVDESGQTLGERRVGEVVTAGPSVTAGYLGNPEATAESFRPDGLRTGDLGYLADGHLYLCGRMKDLIIIRGANFYPQDLEWSVSELEGVRRGNVVAFSVVRDGTEELVVAAEANSGDAARLRTEIAQTLASTFGLTPFHVAIVGVGELPKTSSGKAQRRKTKAAFEAGELPEHP